MTDEPVVEPQAEVEPEPEAEVEEAAELQVITEHCRHCGAPHEMLEGDETDWQCPVCDQYQDTVACPECGQPTRASLMDPAKVPAPHAPTSQRRKRGE